jgi:hypothetical protein
MTFALRVPLLALIALVSLTGASRGQEVLNLIAGYTLTFKVPGADRTGLTAIVGNTDVADVTFGPKNTFIFKGIK